jgi:hypothetical protein
MEKIVNKSVKENNGKVKKMLANGLKIKFNIVEALHHFEESFDQIFLMLMASSQ